jgi:hypothetical protein
MFPVKKRPKDSKVRFVSCHGSLVYTTDMGTGQFYRTSLRDGKTEVKSHTANGTNTLKSAMGVDFDMKGTFENVGATLKR